MGLVKVFQATPVSTKLLAGFSLMEMSVAAGVVGVMFAALLSGMTSSVVKVHLSQEQMRATQIIIEKLDTIRMYRWDRIDHNYIPKEFSETYFPADDSEGGSPEAPVGITYNGQIDIQTPSLSEDYKNDIKQVTVTLSWQTRGRSVQHQMSTFVSRHGLQNYVP